MIDPILPAVIFRFFLETRDLVRSAVPRNLKPTFRRKNVLRTDILRMRILFVRRPKFLGGRNELHFLELFFSKIYLAIIYWKNSNPLKVYTFKMILLVR